MRRTADMKWSPGPEEHELLSEKASAVGHLGSHLLLGVMKDVRIMRKVTRASFCYLGESNGQGKVNDATRADMQDKNGGRLSKQSMLFLAITTFMNYDFPFAISPECRELPRGARNDDCVAKSVNSLRNLKVPTCIYLDRCYSGVMRRWAYQTYNKEGGSSVVFACWRFASSSLVRYTIS